MTPFASVALFRRNGGVVFRPPRKERPNDATQARKAAMRFWSGIHGEALIKVFLVREFAGKLELSERGPADALWKGYDREIRGAEAEPHIAACLIELGVDPNVAPPPLPDVLNINGFVYRREI
ncbi:hypothetical protein D3227_04720 [Mesorhizobium waimense]|uniref:Uncharacterized protein n=1 Tax=Mesorhizobium waimense TaxID=1300307 RepID=A0A3A5L5I5_9HYPH|nr:hypothetical protein [Mesorhizobium waimense]RJT41986.1 hypothetical protein D3227_04720 [Mesorhizobium waimense]